MWSWASPYFAPKSSPHQHEARVCLTVTCYALSREGSWLRAREAPRPGSAPLPGGRTGNRAGGLCGEGTSPAQSIFSASSPEPRATEQRREPSYRDGAISLERTCGGWVLDDLAQIRAR